MNTDVAATPWHFVRMNYDRFGLVLHQLPGVVRDVRILERNSHVHGGQIRGAMMWFMLLETCERCPWDSAELRLTMAGTPLTETSLATPPSSLFLASVLCSVLSRGYTVTDN